MKETFLPNVDDFDAVILGLGGVISNTAPLHARAWQKVFEGYLADRKEKDGGKYEPFDVEKDYQEYICERRCQDGVKKFLQARKITLPMGHYDDKPTSETVWGIANRKATRFKTFLEKEIVEVYQDTVDQVKLWKEQGMKIGVVSYSRHGMAILRSTGLTRFSDAVVDGVVGSRLKLKPKPAPDVLTHASLVLNVDPARTMVIDDTADGIKSARAGGFGFVIGIDRRGVSESLKAAGAHLVLKSLGQLEELVAQKPERRTYPRLPSAMKSLNQIKQRLRKKRLALFFDYDGTLTPIVNRPEDAKLGSDMREVLKETALAYVVAVVSGRDRADVEQFVRIPNLIYAGSHGFDIAGPDDLKMEYEGGKECLPDLDKAEKALSEGLANVPGHQIERKKFAIAVHYRNVPDNDVPKVEPVVDKVLSKFKRLRKSGGKKVFELRPEIEWDKGKAVLWLLKALGLDRKDVVPIYIGDDLTDEDAFAVLKTRGIGIIVGHPERATDATYSVRDVNEVKRFLCRLIGYEEEAISDDGWKFVYEGYNPKNEPLREALCTLGNGYFATRGAGEETEADGIHYPGTYLAGGYNRLNTEIAGRVIENEDLVNWPNWLPLTFRCPGDHWMNLNDVEILEYRQELDLRRGLLERRIRFTDVHNHRTALVTRRLVHMANPHIAAIQWRLTPENWSGPIEIRSALDGSVVNAGVKRYRELNSRHLEPLETAQIGEDSIFLRVRTCQSRVEMCQAARTRVYRKGEEVSVQRNTIEGEGFIANNLFVDCHEGEPTYVEKVVSVYTSRDNAISEAGHEAKNSVQVAANFDRLLDTHARPWARMWNRCDIRIDGNPYAQVILRLNIFHLLQTVSGNSIDLDIGIPARGWHGEAYRGHIFWDELFIFPFLNLRIPMLIRSLLMYRYRRLPEARLNAIKNGYKGAMYPWQSGSSGKEETQVLHLNPRSGRWNPDNTHRQVHINAAIVYNIWEYYQATDDAHFLSHYGAKMILEIARFWSSIATYNKAREKYEIRGAVGPDEYHTKYPNSEEAGLNNNAYTNIMAAWCISRALEVLEMLPEKRCMELRKALEINDRERMRWEQISHKMFIPFHGEGIVSQFEGYDDLKEFDWHGAREKWGDIQRLDRLLEADGDSTNNYKVAKQCDVLMLFYLFSAERLQQVFERLDYPFPPDIIQKNIDYYQKRTSHGSTLSRIVHSWVLARSNREKSWQYFVEALKSDVEDIQGGTTPEGIHLGAMAGTVDLIQRGDLGFAIRDDVLWLNPSLPEQLPRLRLRLLFRRRWVSIHVTSTDFRVAVEEGGAGSVKIGYKGEVYVISQKTTQVFPIHT